MVTPTPVILPPAEPRLQIGQLLPSSAPVISQANFADLRSLAQWGYGSIRSVEVLPDGSAWIVVSEQGIARYELGSLTTPPRWMPFSQPIEVIDSAISSDGRYLMLQYWHLGEERWEALNYVYDMQSQAFVQEVSGVTWNRALTEPDYSSSISVTSPDGAYRYNGGLTHVYSEEYHDYTTEETTLSEMYSASSGELLYTLNDPVQYVRYRDRAMPVACDLYVFSMCGNAVMALAMSPYMAAFSQDGDTFAVLYRAWSLSQSAEFSTLRIYRLADGLLLGQVGSFSDPVVDFTYLRDGKMLVGFLDGSIRVVDVLTQEATWSARHFQQPIWYLAHSHSGKYLIVQRPYEVELRLVDTGVLYGRYAATASAISPVEDLLAYGAPDGSLVLLDLDTLQVVQRDQAHDALIYALAFSPDGDQIITSGQDCAVRLWDAHSVQLLHPFEVTSVDAIGEIWTESRIFLYALNFVPGRDQVIGYGSWGTVVSWSVNSGATQYVTTSAPSYYDDIGLTIHPQFPEWFSVDLEGELFYLDQNGYALQTGVLAGEYQPPVGLPEGCAAGGPLSADGQLRFTLGYDTRQGQVCVLDVATLELLHTLEVIPAPANQIFGLTWLYLSPDGTTLLLPSSTGMIYVYQVEF
jgi:WD40 repeat protein